MIGFVTTIRIARTGCTFPDRKHQRSARLRRGLVAIVACVLASTATSTFVGAQPTRGTASVSTRTAADSGTTSYDVGGIRVIHRYVTANEVVAANVYLLGGTRQLTPATAGIEQLLLEASGYGTRRYPRDTLRRRIAALGSEIDVSAGIDWTRIGLRATSSTFDSTWTMLADRLVAPTLDSSAIELVRAQILTAVRQRRDDPDALVSYLADSVAYVDHPYSIDPVGTERSIASITRADLARYHAQEVSASRLLVVIVGQVERARIERLVQSTLGTLPRGQYTWSEPPAPVARGDALAVAHRTLPTNYILGFFHGPPSANSRDYNALRVATAVLSGRLFGEIRSRRNLTYAVSAPFLERALSAGGIYVTTVSPDLTMGLIRDEVEALQRDVITRQGLSELVQQFITEYFLNNETNAAQADFLARAQLYQGDYRAAERFVDDLRNVGPEDIRRVARMYLRDARFAYVGDTTKISREALTKF
jgi:zinc protease